MNKATRRLYVGRTSAEGQRSRLRRSELFLASRLGRALIMAVVICSGTAACGATSSGAGSAASSSDDTFNVGFEVGALPMTDYTSDNKSFQGVNYDMMTAIAKKVGVKFNYSGASWPSLIPGVQAGRYDLALSGIYDKKDREQVVDLVTYMNDGSVLVVAAASNLEVKADTLCGHTVGTQTGSAQAALLPTQSAKCEADGKKPITVKEFDSLPNSALAVTSGRIDALSCNATQCGYLVKTRPSDLKLSGEAYDPTPIAMAVRKGSGLSEKMQKAVQELINDGEYAKILDQWGQSHAAITNPQINPLTSSK